MTSSYRESAWEERWHPLREEWVIIAAHRQNRPWIGATVDTKTEPIPTYLPDCYLCPGNRRVSGITNPDYRSTFVFDNDHPCVGMDAPAPSQPGRRPASSLHTDGHTPYRSRPAQGYARVICYSARHDLTMAELSLPAVEEVVQVWQQQTLDLGNQPVVNHVLLFENKGEVVGVSNPHPHAQVYATNFVFKTIETEVQASQRYLRETGHALFADIIAAEQQDGRRILYEDEYSIAFVPYFARYAYEVYIAPKQRVAHVHALCEAEVESLARALKSVTVRYDNLWQMSFPYVMTLHQAPTDTGEYGAFHFFIAFHPPLRQPNVLKYLAGPEIGGGNFVSDTLPEEKAAELRALPTEHYQEMRQEQ
ncbi:MAG TPA: galactose-1-phosphate uridylyltransferase [Ktedonosporobacter sp.]|nr:galactose-1-phosphate uridylyltransferase [Ktedonosporobacter sp.]